MGSIVYNPHFREFIPGTNNPAVGYLVATFAAGTSTPLAVFTDAACTVPAANPFILDANGEAVTYAPAGSLYKIQLQDPTTVVQWTVDNVTIGGGSGGGGGGGGGGTGSEWIASGLVPTFIAGGSLTVPGNQTSTFQVGRRIQTQNTAGLVYSTITSAIFAAGVTTLVLLNDGTSLLDSGLSVLNYGILNSTNFSLPERTRILVTRNATQAILAATETTVLFNTTFQDLLSEFSSGTGKITLKQNGGYQINFMSGVSVAQIYFVVLRANGSDTSNLMPLNQNGTTTEEVVVQGFYFGSAGDILEMRISGPLAFTLGGGTAVLPQWTCVRMYA